MSDNLRSLMEKDNMTIQESQLIKFDSFKEILLEWNKVMNLTAIEDDYEIDLKHFFDSVIPLKLWDFSQGSKIIDIGTGAGFPGIPLKIMRDDLDITLMDSLNKRIRFLDQVIADLNMTGITGVHARAEELGRNKNHREKYDFAISRAVSRLNTLSEYCLPFVKVGGHFISMKGPKAKEEVEESKKAIELLGGKISQVIEYNIGDTENRTLVVIEKIKSTDKKYPRGGGKPKSKPL